MEIAVGVRHPANQGRQRDWRKADWLCRRPLRWMLAVPSGPGRGSTGSASARGRHPAQQAARMRVMRPSMH